ncbi:MAG: Leucine--tRNA ligase [Fimbriimonadaceae bacterium]|nr:Leucine--tRNA ligase [Fimbriimonadaceae bacterium]
MPDRYEPAQFEEKWRRRWADADLFRTREDRDRPKWYSLEFFPYPSGHGLSVGHCRNYVPCDVLARTRFMQGYNVLHPMGFDAFGLPAENAAIQTKRNPAELVHEYGETYRRQLTLIGIGYDWSRSFYSSDPSYYRWTQWIFKLLYQRGLAYRRLAAVNWDPVDKTVLADEEIIGGRAERSGALVEKRYIPQWFFKITEYAQRLLDDLDELDWPEGIKQMQRNWIGRSEGVEFEMVVDVPVADSAEAGDFEVKNLRDKRPSFRVFTTRIDTIFGMTFCVLAPEHPMVGTLLPAVAPEHADAVRAYREAARELSDIDRQATTREKTGVFLGAYAINPATGKRVPIYVADYVLMGYGTGAIMAVPAHDDRDFEFAAKYGIDVVPVIKPVGAADVPELPFATKDGVMINSGEYDGMTVQEGQKSLAVWMEGLGIGQRKVNFKLRDWLISRQRYWGCPIPITYDAEGDMHAVPDDALPVYLPDIENYEPAGDGSSPLSTIPDFVNCTGADGRLHRRETDTMGGFACSSWYFMRFCDPHNEREAYSKEAVDYWMAVDCYVGGAEHAVMHLLYARFWTKVLFDAGLSPVQEPFKRLVNQGMVLAETPYRKPREGERLHVGEEGILVTFEEAASLPKDQLIWKWDKMSKSKGNVVTPEEAVDKFGADALRLYLLFVAPFEQDVQWSETGIQGPIRFLHRLFKLVDDAKAWFEPNWRGHLVSLSDLSEGSRVLRRSTHLTIADTTDSIMRFACNTYVSSLMKHLNTFGDFLKETGTPDTLEQVVVSSEALEVLLTLLSPAAPHTSDELWEQLGQDGFVYLRDWPIFDPDLAKADRVTIAVQVNGKLRDTFDVEAGADAKTVEELALAREKVMSFTDGKGIRKVIVVPGKLVNVVTS